MNYTVLPDSLKVRLIALSLKHKAAFEQDPNVALELKTKSKTLYKLSQDMEVTKYKNNTLTH